MAAVACKRCVSVENPEASCYKLLILFFFSEDTSKQATNNKQLPTTKWKRDRRSRLPEYSRKSDPKIAETLQEEIPEIAPLDMSVRQRGLPPSYSQTVNNPGYRSNYRPSVIQNREDLPPG